MHEPQKRLKESVVDTHERTDDLLFTLSVLRDFLVNTCNTYVRDLTTAEDLVHDVYCRILPKLPLLNPDINFRAYITESVINESINHIRRQKTLQEIQPKIANTSWLSPSDLRTDLDSLYLKYLTIQTDFLPPRAQKAFLLKHGYCHSVREIAIIMKVSVNTVKTHLRLARTEIRKSWPCQ